MASRHPWPAGKRPAPPPPRRAWTGTCGFPFCPRDATARCPACTVGFCADHLAASGPDPRCALCERWGAVARASPPKPTAAGLLGEHLLRLQEAAATGAAPPVSPLDLHLSVVVLLGQHVRALGRYRLARPCPPPPARRGRPGWDELWRRYCHTVLAGRRPPPTGLVRAWRDPEWRRIVATGYAARPGPDAILDLLGRHGVRPGGRRAAWLRTAWGRDFEALARQARATLRAHHDAGQPDDEHRTAELELVRLFAFELRGCGGTPAAVRLLLLRDAAGRMGRDFRHVVPLDAPWQRGLASVGCEPLRPGALAAEEAYRGVEQTVCDAAGDLALLPVEADGGVAGWAAAQTPPGTPPARARPGAAWGRMALAPDAAARFVELAGSRPDAEPPAFGDPVCLFEEDELLPPGLVRIAYAGGGQDVLDAEDAGVFELEPDDQGDQESGEPPGP